ncbi:hypothetical protein JTE90_008899 [Oedothorax gibbosus]|uniref:Sulfotransferase domain-containing protein n=1 Tax=Oedothorax gibbosus TaxID=931172 RepID=A0AAV6UJZ0_9ARAC|nr:hypothetical protein JTE90_008899 [Oedothorax gibbosus]
MAQEHRDESNISEGSDYLPECYLVDGFPVWKIFPVEDTRASIDYKPSDDDIFLCSFPKCGTTWALHTLALILRHGENFEPHYNVMQSGPSLGREGIEVGKTLPRPFAWRTHLPFYLMPWSDKAKYIYVTRNPKDAAVSSYYLLKNMMGFTGTFDEYFEYFITGRIGSGDFFDHLEGWYEQRNRPNVLFVTYEEMKEDPEAAILKMASFVDDAKFAEPLRQDQQKLENVLKYSSFKEMKVTINKSMDVLASKTTVKTVDGRESELSEGLKSFFSKKEGNKDAENVSEKPKSCDFVRKGIVGDWRNHFSEEQNRRLNEKFAERTKNIEIAMAWEKYM